MLGGVSFGKAKIEVSNPRTGQHIDFDDYMHRVEVDGAAHGEVGNVDPSIATAVLTDWLTPLPEDD